MNRSSFLSRPALSVALITLSLGMAASAQPMLISRTVTASVKSDRAAEFEAAVKDYNAAYAKTPNPRARLDYQALTGAVPRHRLVVSYADWAALDAAPTNEGSADLARALNRIRACLDSSTTVVTELLPDVSTPPMPNEPPTLVRISRTRIRIDKIDEWLALVKNELLPAYKKAGRTLTVRQVRLGGPTNEFFLSTRVANWADANKNWLIDSMGAEAYNRMSAKLTALTTYRERDLYRYRADLSYSPPR